MFIRALGALLKHISHTLKQLHHSRNNSTAMSSKVKVQGCFFAGASAQFSFGILIATWIKIIYHISEVAKQVVFFSLARMMHIPTVLSQTPSNLSDPNYCLCSNLSDGNSRKRVEMAIYYTPFNCSLSGLYIISPLATIIYP